MQPIRRTTRRAWIAAAALLSVLPALAKSKTPPTPPSPPAPPGASGTFVDRDGGRHAWQVNRSFSLLWEGEAYLPAGMAWTAKSLSAPEDAAAWDADLAALRALKAAGIRDVWVSPGRNAPAVPPSAWQRLIDQLEAEGFRYGLAFPASPREQASGYYVRSGTFRSEPLRESGDCALELRIPGYGGDFQRVAAVILDADTGKMVTVQWAKVEESAKGVRATVPVTVPARGQYVVEMVPLLGKTPGLPDFWGGADAARESLQALAALRFGPGLRFLVHPYSETLDLDGPAGYVVPVSTAYQVEFEAFLTRRYRNIDRLRNRWAFRTQAPETFEEAARLVPLAMGVVRDTRLGYLMDEKELRSYAIEPGDSSFWYDHLYFRETSLREQFNLAADLLRQSVADVPVVSLRAGVLRYIDVADRAAGGFAGLGARLNPLNLEEASGVVVGAALQGVTRPWCVALAVEGYPTKEALHAALDTSRRIGMKGWFAAAGGTAPADLPAWMASYQETLAAQKEAADFAPYYTLYPQPIRETGGFANQHPEITATTRPLGPDVWWVPTLPPAAWHVVDVGDELKAYAMQTGLGYDVYLWSPQGKRTVHLRPAGIQAVEVRSPKGDVLKRHTGDGKLRIELSEVPVVVSGMLPHHVVPIEVAVAELKELERLVKELGVRTGNARELQSAVMLARSLDPDKHPREVHNMVRGHLRVIQRLLQAPATPQPTAGEAKDE